MTNTPGESPESLLGIEYERYFAQPLAGIFAFGEHEWLQFAPETYGDDAGEVWASDIFPRFQAGNLEEIDLEDLQRYTPNMLEQLSGMTETPLTEISL